MTITQTAEDMFRVAYENRYTWDENFPGYSADLTLTHDNHTYQAQILVNSDLGVEVTGLDEEKLQEGVYNQLRDIITHRKRNSFVKAHGKNKFTLGEKDATGAVEILVEGDAMGSNYKVQGPIISQVNRVMGPISFTINTEETWQTEAGYLPLKYHAIFRNPKTNELTAKREFTESYGKFGNYYLPTSQVIESLEAEKGKTITKFEFSNIQLLGSK
jgi:hypothetical protein